MSSKALSFGEANGLTAEFIVQQTSKQLINTIDDMFSLFDIFQEALYSNDPQVQSDEQQQRSTGMGGFRKVIYEESILMTLLGPDYLQLI